MKNYKLPPRKPDLLDELNALQRRRGIAYRAGKIEELEMVHLEMKAFWLRNGWSEDEANEEYLTHGRECAKACIAPKGNTAITHVVIDTLSGQLVHLNSITELSNHWLNEKLKAL